MKKSFFIGNFVFINEENKSKEIQGKNVLSFTKFVLGGFCPGGLAWGDFVGRVFVGGFMSGGFLSCHLRKYRPINMSTTELRARACQNILYKLDKN